MREKERKIWFHWQNLNERVGDRYCNASGNPIVHGRAWLHLFGLVLHWSWNLKSHFCHANLDFDGDEFDVSASLAVPPVAFWVGLEGWRWPFRALGLDWASCKERGGPNYVYAGHRRIKLSVHDWTLWWKLWAMDGCWTSTTPRWQDGSFCLLDFVLGRRRYSEQVLESRAVKISMPEGAYDATAQLKLATWKRSRWPFAKRWTTVNIDVPNGIPVPGKGENSWDCGPDALFGQSGPARTIEEGIGNVVASALRDRQRRAGTHEYAERAAE